MQQVLEGMKDQNWRNVIDDRRSKARSSLNLSYALGLPDSLGQRDGHCHSDNAA
jgi:hypothetical protein